MVNNQCAGIYGKCLNIKITNYCPGNCYFCIERDGYKPSITSVENIINKAIYYKCQIVSIENLNMKSSDKDKGKDYNALCNNHWLRTTFCNQLRKRTTIHKI